MKISDRLAESAQLLDRARLDLHLMTRDEKVRYAHAQATLVAAVLAAHRPRIEGWLERVTI